MKKKILILLLVVLALTFCVQAFTTPSADAKPGYGCFKEWYFCPNHYRWEYVWVCCMLNDRGPCWLKDVAQQL
ncbi:MAG TPA: hypothetical protein VGB16_00085 [candidate division Zixibacteria bacterium]